MTEKESKGYKGCPSGWHFVQHKPVYSRAEVDKALSEAIRLKSHYAKLLNQHDGGHRIIFDTVEKWMERLEETGTLRNL